MITRTDEGDAMYGPEHRSPDGHEADEYDDGTDDISGVIDGFGTVHSDADPGL